MENGLSVNQSSSIVGFIMIVWEYVAPNKAATKMHKLSMYHVTQYYDVIIT